MNTKNNRGYTALYIAESRGFTEVCAAILARADFLEVNAKSTEPAFEFNAESPEFTPAQTQEPSPSRQPSGYREPARGT